MRDEHHSSVGRFIGLEGVANVNSLYKNPTFVCGGEGPLPQPFPMPRHLLFV